MPELFEGIVATRTVCAEGSLDLVSEKTRPRRQDQGCPRVTGYAWPLFLQTARAPRQDTALMLKTRARYVPWSLRQPLLALEATTEKGAQGRLWTSTLTEPPEGVGCLGVECAEAREASTQAEGGTVVGTSLYCVFWLSVWSCLSQE